MSWCQLADLKPAPFDRNVVAVPRPLISNGRSRHFFFLFKALAAPQLAWEQRPLVATQPNIQSAQATRHAHKLSQCDIGSSFFACIQVKVWDLDTHAYKHMLFASYAITMWNFPECIISHLLCIVSYSFFFPFTITLVPTSSFGVCYNKRKTPHTSSASTSSDHEVMTSR